VQTIICDPGTAVIPAGTTIPLLLTGTATPGPISMTPAYTSPSSPTATLPPVTFTYQFDAWAGTAAVSPFTGTAAPTMTCSNASPGKTATAPIFIGDTFSCTVTYPSGQTPSFVTVAPAAGSGTLATLNTTGVGVVTSSRPAPNTVGFACGTQPPSATNTGSACTAFTFTGTAASAGTPSFIVTSFALGAAAPYKISPPLAGSAAAAPTGPIFAALACANATKATDIAFPALPASAQPPAGGIQPAAGGILVSQVQFMSHPPVSDGASAPAVLSLAAPNVAAICGAVFEDSGAQATDSDANPMTIDGGTIIYQLNSPFAVFAENGLTTFIVQCGTLTAPGGTTSGVNSCNGAVYAPPFLTPPQTPAFLSPHPSNVVHVALAPGATFGLLGTSNPSVSLVATYSRAPALGPALVLTTNIATIAIVQAGYQMTLTASPTSISAAASATGIGSTITASLAHPNTAGCQPLPQGGFVACTGTPNGTPTSASAGAESGMVTFKTNAGAVGAAADPSTAATQLAISIHCGPIQDTSVIVAPLPGAATAPSSNTSPSFTSCTSVSAVLYGAGGTGTATVSATFIGDITGATANATTTVQLSTPPGPTALARGCNQVVTPSTVQPATPVTAIVSLVTPGNIVTAVWTFNNATHSFQAGYFNLADTPLDFLTVGPDQPLFICTSGPGTFAAA